MGRGILRQRRQGNVEDIPINLELINLENKYKDVIKEKNNEFKKLKEVKEIVGYKSSKE